MDIYLTFSTFFIDVIANSKYFFMSSPPMVDMSFNVCLCLIKLRYFKKNKAN